MLNGLQPVLAAILACFILSSASPAWTQEKKDEPSKSQPKAKPSAAKPAAAAPGRQDVHGVPGADIRREGDFRDRRDARQWNDHDRAVWRGGNWHQDWHSGRYGWWWEVDGNWYFYDQPAYPYPLIVSTIVDVPPFVAAPGIGIGVAAPMAAAPPPPPTPVAAQPATWYYCDNPPGYSPYVQACAAGWRPVPAQPR